MARIRTIKPEFFTSEDIVSLSPLARLLYVATWCEADKEGRMVWKPRTFKLRYFPGDSCDIDELCAELVAGCLIVLYGDGLAYIPKFKSHQHLNPRESASSLPEPSQKLTRAPRVLTRAPRVDDASIQELTDREEGKGREGKGKERNNPPTTRERVVSPPSPKCPEDVAEQVWMDWNSLRRQKRAPVTETVLEDARTQAGLAGLTLEAFLRVWCSRGSQGLQADWLKPPERGRPLGATTETAWAREARQSVERMTGGLVSAKPPGTTKETIDGTGLVNRAA